MTLARIYSSVVTAGDEANGHIRPSSPRWFVQYGLDRVRWLALILGHCRCVDELESKLYAPDVWGRSCALLV